MSEEDSKKENEDGEEEEAPQDILLVAAALRFQLKRQRDMGDDGAATRTREELFKLIRENTMIAYYKAVCKENGVSLDSAFLESMTAAKSAKLAEFEEEKVAAEKQEGEVEIHDIELKIGAYLGVTDTLTNVIKSLSSITKITSGKKIDARLRIMRLCLAWMDDHRYSKNLPETTRLIDLGGDWDRRNRFTVYNGIHYFRIRNFDKSARCFLDAIATFTATEIFSYEVLVHFTIIAAVVSLPRTMIKEKLIDAPEIRQVILEMPVFGEYLHAFYECRYGDFFKALIGVMKFIRENEFLNVHGNYYLREMRLRAYDQFLRSYLSVKLSSMAKEFGLSEEFIDEELSEFIAGGRLQCKMNRVTGVVEMKRMDSRATHFGDLIKKGDLLMNRVQRLSRVIT